MKNRDFLSGFPMKAKRSRLYWTRMSRIFWALAISFSVGGCINLTPEYTRPDLGIQRPDTYQHAPEETVGPELADRWWQVFGDPQLEALVQEVLENNWDLKAAVARILEARAVYVQVRSDRFPAVDLEFRKDRRRLSGGAGSSGTIIDTYELAAQGFFEYDLWQRFASAGRAAWDDILRSEENRRAVAQTLAAETIRLYLEMEAIERRLQIAYRSIETFQQSVQFVETRYRRGLISVLDVRQARRTLAQAEAIVPELQQRLGIVQQQMAVLLGRYPETRPARFQPEDYYRRLAPVPAGLPSDLLRRRPDIRAAEVRLKSLNERVGVAIANRFPRISLTGKYGWSSDALSGMVGTDNLIWNLTGNLIQPIFSAGALKAGQRAAEARYQEGVADYANTVLNALAEVERALLTRQRQLERRERVLRFVDEARATQTVAQNRYIRGLVDYLNVLNAQATRFQAEDDLVLVDLAILANRVELHRALGGGWADPGPIETKDDGIFFRF